MALDRIAHRIERINVRQAEYDLFSARGTMDVSVGAAIFYENRTVPVGSIWQEARTAASRQRH